MAKANDMQENFRLMIDTRIQKLVPDIVEEVVERVLNEALGTVSLSTESKPKIVRRRRKSAGNDIPFPSDQSE